MKKLLLTLLCLLVVVNANALNETYKRAVKDRFKMLLYERPEIKYVWGAANPLQGKADCSGYIFWVFNDAGLPVQRTTALEMRLGHAGWVGKDISLDDANETDIIWWTWKDTPGRPNGHVGAFFEDKTSKLLEVTHASSTAGHVVHQPLKGKLLTDISAIRAITLGDGPKLGKGVKQIK